MNAVESGNDLYRGILRNYDTSSATNWIFHRKTLTCAMTSFALVLFASAARGEIFLFAVMLWKNWDQFQFLPGTELYAGGEPIDAEGNASQSLNVTTEKNTPNLINVTEPPMNAVDEFLKHYHMQHCYIHVPAGLASSFFLFFFLGGFLQWNYYVKQRDRPEEWKCQPKRFLTPENERHEILLGTGCLLLAGTITGLIATYVINGGELSLVYFDINKYGWLYFFFSTIVLFLMQDAGSYYFHRMLHYPFFYRNFHKWHHRYHAPTAYSAVAMHPIESTMFQLILLAPLFIVPLHFVSVVGTFYYMFYFGMIDHSGIDLDSIWPWQPPVRFHDDHHKHFHCNFGFNTMIFDRFHGTLRRKDRRYGEDVFYGKGASLKSKGD